MRRLALIAGLLIAPSAPAMAQDASPIQVFGGYSYLRLNGDANLHGWNASVAGDIKRWIKIVGDFSGHYGSLSQDAEFFSVDFPQISARPGERANLHSFLFGPQFSFYKNERIEPFFQILMGAAYLRANAAAKLGDISIDVPFASTSFASGVGGGLDIKLKDSFSLRLIKADYLLTTLGNQTQRNLRLSVGIVLR